MRALLATMLICASGLLPGTTSALEPTQPENRVWAQNSPSSDRDPARADLTPLLHWGNLDRARSNASGSPLATKGTRVFLGPGAAGANSFVRKIVNSNMGHAAERAVERAGFASVKDARAALQAFGRGIQEAGQFPARAIVDPARADRVIVPGFGNGGAVVYQLGKEGAFKLKTVLQWLEP